MRITEWFRRPGPRGGRYGIVNNVAAATTATSVSVGTSAVLVLAANPQRQWAAVANLGAATVYLGGTSGVVTGPISTAAAGFPVPAGATLPLPVGGGAWYAISGTSAQDVRVLEVS